MARAARYSASTGYLRSYNSVTRHRDPGRAGQQQPRRPAPTQVSFGSPVASPTSLADMGVPLCVSAAFTIAFISCACMEITMAEFVGVDIPMFWEDARDYCRANYQDLATIHSAQDNADVAAACRTTQPAVWLGNIRPCMIGLNDIQSEGNWVWSDGSPYNGAYTNWITEPQQPNNERGGEDAGYMAICFEDCAGDYNHKWGDGNFGKTQDGQSPVPTTFVCECGAQCDSDATTDAVCDDSKCSSVGNDCW
eukprot:SAG31_NODE_1710_length_7473_cov_3.782072_6_plen_251_part_00